MHPWTHSSPRPKRHLDQFSHFCTAHSSVSSVGHKWAYPSPKNCLFAWGNLHPHLIHGSLSTPEPTTQMASRSVQPFLHSSLQNIPILYNRLLFRPLKLLLPMGESAPHLIHDSLGPSKPTTEKGSQSVRSFLHTYHRLSIHCTMGRSLPLKIVPFHGGIWTPV